MRIAPDDISFARADAWNGIHAHRPGHSPFPKNPVWFAPTPEQPSSLIIANITDHARKRRILKHSVTEKALRAQTPIINSYVDLLIIKLTEKIAASDAKKSQHCAGHSAMVQLYDI